GTYPPTAAPVAFPRPVPGVWEVNVANNDVRNFDETATEAPKPKQVKITATALMVDIEAAPPDRWMQADGSASFPVHLKNRLGNATAVTTGPGTLASAFQTSRKIAQGEQHLYEVIVPKGATSLRAKIGTADKGADLDLYLLDCTDPVPKPDAKPYKR